MKTTKTTKTMTTTATLLGLGLMLSGCAGSPADTGNAAAPSSQAATQASALQVSDAWAKAAQSGMSAAFGTLHNGGSTPLQLTSVSDADGNDIQIHETTGSGSAASMKQMAGGLRIEPGQDAVLEPGGNHLMFMDLAKPLVAAGSTTLTLGFADGSSTEVPFEIRSFSGANEDYHGTGGHDASHHGG